MINEIQEKFLNSLPSEKLNRIVTIEPWDPRSIELANDIISNIHRIDSELPVSLAGSAALHIAGERDLDIGGLAPKSQQKKHAQKLSELLGKPQSVGKLHLGWTFEREGFNVSFFIADPASENTQVQMKFYEIMRARPDLLKEYEKTKLKMSGKTYREYQEAKYAFFNRILGQN